MIWVFFICRLIQIFKLRKTWKPVGLEVKYWLKELIRLIRNLANKIIPAFKTALKNNLLKKVYYSE